MYELKRQLWKISITVGLEYLKEVNPKMKHCSLCNESFDDQFISKYETLAHNKKVLQVCEYCNDEHSDYDDGEEMTCIYYGNSIFYPSNLL